MANKFLLSIMLMSFLLLPAISHACDAQKRSTLEREKIELSDLNSGKTEIFNFRTGDCTPLRGSENEVEVGDHMLRDETTLGIYQEHRDQGENKIDALKDTLKFDIQEQEG